jgi:hypothetical protein
MSVLHGLSLTFAMGLFATAAFAQGASTTVGESMASGRMSQGAAEQFVAGSGYSVDEAQSMAINEIAFIKWGDD